MANCEFCKKAVEYPYGVYTRRHKLLHKLCVKPWRDSIKAERENAVIGVCWFCNSPVRRSNGILGAQGKVYHDQCYSTHIGGNQ